MEKSSSMSHKEMVIDPLVEQASMRMMVGLRKSMDEMFIKAGFSPEEIQKLVERAMEGIYVDGAPIRGKKCKLIEG